MAEQREGETWGGRFLDYLGLGLILTATDILVREGAIRLAGALYIVGGIILFAGLNWKTLRHKFAGSTVNRLETIGVDPRYWLAVFALLLICARITMILPFAENAATPVNGVVVPRSDYDEQSAKLAKANDEIATLTQQRERAAQILAEIQQQIEVMKSRLEERERALANFGSLNPFSTDWLTPGRKEAFRQATYSVSDAWVARTKMVSISATASSQAFAEALADLFIISGFQPKDQSGGRGGGRPYYVGTEKDYRFKPGITIAGPVPDATVEAVRVAFERISIRTERGKDDQRDYLTVEVGRPTP